MFRMTVFPPLSGQPITRRTRQGGMRMLSQPGAQNVAATFLDLAERCEAAAGPDTVLDAELHMALRGYTLHEETDPASGHFAFWEGEPWKSHCTNCSSWTSPTGSLDEATTLVPQGWAWQYSSLTGTANVLSIGDARKTFGHAHSAPLAIAAAALRARAYLSPRLKPNGQDREAGLECEAPKAGPAPQ